MEDFGLLFLRLQDKLDSILIIIFIACTIFVVWDLCEDKYQKDAIKHGCAEYYLDNNFEKQWRWVVGN